MVWTNLVAYSVQVLALVAVGGILPLLLRIHQPRAQLLYFRLLLAASLLLPALQPWRRPVVVVTEAAAVPTVTGAPATNQSPAQPRIRWEETALGIVCAGAVVRVLWLLIGMWRLRRLRTGSTPLDPLPEAVEAARLRTGAEAAVCISEEAGGPVTFGARRAVILLPPALLDQPSEAQFGIACHEFLHVRRHDWLYTVCEEFAGALVWFHPAVWWLLGQIRLAREQVVDREVVSLTEAREPYVHALLAMGGARPQFDLAPATLFLRKRHLANRVHSLLKEVTMSKGRLILSYVLTAAVVLAAAWFTVVSFPLEATPLVQARDASSPGVVAIEVTPSLPEPVLSNLRARLAAFQGQPYTSESRTEILKAAREVESTARILMAQQTEMLDGSLVARFVVTASPGLPPPSRSRMPSGKVHIDVSRLPEPPQSAMRARLAPYEGQPSTLALYTEVGRLAKEVDAAARIGAITPPPTVEGSPSTTLWITFQNESGAPSSAAARVQVSGEEQSKKLLSMARPQYPPLARQARIQGTVRFSAVIDREGRVSNLTLVSGHPLLVPAAEEAVKQWTYEPTVRNGEPAEVVTQIDVNFSLL